MKKYPFSKKLVSMMLATALAVTPLANVLPVGGTTVVSAAALSEQQISEKIRALSTKVYNFYQHAGSVSVETIEWKESFYPPHLKSLENDDKRKKAYREVMEALSNIIYKSHTNATSIATDITKFRADQGGNFKTVFENDNEVTTDKLLLFFEKLEAKINSQAFLITAVGASYSSALSAAVTQVISDNQELRNFNNKLNTHLGTGISGLMDIQGLINNQIDSNKAARSKLVESGVTAKGYNISYDGTVGLNQILSLKFNVSTAGITGVDIANSLDWEFKVGSGAWKSIPFNANGPKITLSSYGDYTVRAKLHNDSIVVKTRTISLVNPNAGNGGNGGGGGGGATPTPTPTPTTPAPTPTPTVPPTPAPGNVIVPADVKKVETVQRADGRSAQVVSIDPVKLTEAIKAETKLDRVTVVVENKAGEVAEVRVPSQAFTAIADKNPNAQVVVVSQEGAYRLPVSEINVTNLAKDLGVAAGTDVTVSIQISETTDTSGALTKGNLTAASKIVEFKVVASAGGKEVALDRFSNYVEREIVGEKSFNPNRSIVVQLLDNGSVRAVPTVFEGNRAIFKSQTNSKYTVIESSVTFPDLGKDYWAKDTIETLASKQIFKGFNDGEFKPLNPTTRLQVALLITRSLGLSTDKEYSGQFKDIKGTEWFANEIMPAIETGIIKGSNGEFRPNDQITREEAAVMFARAVRYVKYDESKLDKTKKITSYKDSNSIAKWAAADVEFLLQAGVMTGRDTGFAAKAINNRAETAALLTKYLKTIDFMN